MKIPVNFINKKIIIVLLGFAAQIEFSIGSGVIVSYIPSWSQDKLDISAIDGSLMTHLIYAFIPINANGTIRVENPDHMVKLKSLKAKYKNLKVLPSVGGATWRWMFDYLSSDDLIKVFSQSCKSLIDQYGFDGIDIDWEYPYGSEIVKYAKLLQSMRETLGPNLLIMSAVPAGNQNFVGFDQNAMNKYLDLVTVMCYDYHGAGWESQTGHNAPLFGSGPYTTKGSIDEWIKKGVKVEKLVIGLPFYGRTWTLQSPIKNGVGAASIGVGSGEGFLSWDQVKNRTWTEYWDDVAKVPYAVNGSEWLSFDNERSLTEKIKWTCQNKYRGVMIWEISQDRSQYLSRLVKSQIDVNCNGLPASNNISSSSRPIISSVSTLSTLGQSTTSKPGLTQTTKPGLFGGSCLSDLTKICQTYGPKLNTYPPNCNKYVDCRLSTPYLMPCPQGLHFNAVYQYCDFPELANCKSCP